MKTMLYCIMVALYWFSAYTYVPTMTPYLTDLGISYSMIGLIGSAYGITQVFLRIPLGIASDRIRRRRAFITAGFFFSVLSSIGFFFTENEWLIFLFRAVSGVGASAWVIMVVLFSSYFTVEEASAKTSRLSMINMIGQTAGMLSGAVLAGYAGYKSPFVLSIAVGAAAVILSLLVEEVTPPAAKAPPSFNEMLQVGKNRALLIRSVLSVMVQIILFGAMITFLPEVARNLGASTQTLGYLFFISSLPRIFSDFMFPFVYARVKERTLASGAFLLASAAIAATPFSPNLPVLFALTVLGGIGIGMAQTSTLVTCTREIADSLKSTGMGIYQAIYGIGIAAGPALVGVVSDQFGITAGYIFASGVSLTGAALALIFIGGKQARSA